MNYVQHDVVLSGGGVEHFQGASLLAKRLALDEDGSQSPPSTTHRGRDRSMPWPRLNRHGIDMLTLQTCALMTITGLSLRLARARLIRLRRYPDVGGLEECQPQLRCGASYSTKARQAEYQTTHQCHCLTIGTVQAPICNGHRKPQRGIRTRTAIITLVSATTLQKRDQSDS